ncbi:MAG: CoA pyrophosphatase [Pseudomonadota bacterium]
MSVGRSALDARDRLVARLAGSQPDHSAAQLRLGAGLARDIDPRLAALMPTEPRLAAVLIGLTESAAGPGVLLTLRSTALRQHAGQISFPGGAVDADDAGPAAAALREASEEVGLAVQQVQVVGYLPDQLVITGFRITPVVARIAPHFVPRLDTDEVQECFDLPFDVLMDPANHQQSSRRIGEIEMATRDIQFGERRIWGATAAMLLALYELALP